MNNIWMYWENKMPEYIKLCIKSIEKRKGNLILHLLTPETINQFLPDIRPDWYQLKPAHKADYIRTRLVYQYGGMWLDCDMLALNDLEPLFDFPEKYDYACQNITSSIGCFIARPKCIILEQVIAAQDQILDQHSVDISWNNIGNGLLKKLGQDYPYYRWKEWTLDEISGGKISKFFSCNENIANHLDRNAVIFHLCNEQTGKLIRKYLRDDRLLTSHMLISQIFRHAFDIKNEPTEKIEWVELIKDYNFSYALKDKLASLCKK